MTENWSLYHPEIPEFLCRLAETPPMARLRQVGMNCGCEYTSFPHFAGWAPYSRFDHSVGVGLIVWHFTGDLRQSAAGLLHDAATPAFAHVVDFLHGDHLHQERYFINCFCVDRLHDSLVIHITELSYFFAESVAQRVFGTEHQYVRLNTYALEFLDRMLCRFGFQLSGSGKIRHICQVYAKSVLTQLPFQLADTFEVGE